MPRLDGPRSLATRVAAALASAAAFLALAGPALGDTLELRDGTLVAGQYLGGTQHTVRFQMDTGLQTYQTADIVALTFTGGGPGPVASPPPPASSAPPPAQAALPPVPAGAPLVVRMDSAIDSRTHGVGQRFTGSLQADLVAGGRVIAPLGSPVHGRLAQAKQSGHAVGQSELTVELTEILIDNRLHPVLTSEVMAVGERTGRQTARRTVAGALIGGAIDGSEGAKTGAAIGVGVSILTRGKSVNIPAGTVLEFRLAAPFTPQN